MKPARRQFLQTTGGAAATMGGLLSVGCDARAMLPWKYQAASELKPFDSPSGETVDLISHALSRLTWGAAPGDYTRVSKLAATPDACLDAFVEEQLTMPPDADSPAARAVSRLSSLHQKIGDSYDTSPRQLNFELTQAAILRFVYSPNQLYEVMVSFWTDHFNIDCSKTECRWLKAWDDREVIRKHALGNFKSMLRASALSPAMLFYLDGRANRKEKPEDKPNENYARELLELHTLGVYGGYTQQDVTEVARCLTGWTVNGKEGLRGDNRSKNASTFARRYRNVALTMVGMGDKADAHWGLGRVHFDNTMHDGGKKTVLGHTIDCEQPSDELDRVLDIVMRHPATSKFIATKLCRRFIDDTPPESAVLAVAEAFRNSGGEIKPTLRALFRTAEFRTARATKLKRPLHWVVSALRATRANTKAGGDIHQFLRRAGQMPFEFPTPDGYSDEAKDWNSGLLARWDLALKLARGSLTDTKFDATAFLQAAGSRNAAIRHFLARQPLTHELEALQMVQGTDREADGEFVALALASPAFQLY